MFRRLIEEAVKKEFERLAALIEAAVIKEFDRRSDLIETAVEKVIERRTVRPDRKLTVEGYNPLPEIMGQLYEWVFIPFNGKELLVQIRYPKATQLPDVDKLSHLVDEKIKDRKLTHQQMVEVLNIQEECCRAVLKCPSFEELECAIYGDDSIYERKRKELKEIQKKINTLSGQEKHELQMEHNKVELFAGYILPDDTMLCLTKIALGTNVTDIKKLTKDRLISAYNKARLYNGRPSDFIPGIFTDGDRMNIDDYATMLGLEEEAKNSKKGK